MAEHTVASLIQTCTACPAQWEGYTHNNEPLYIRYRWGQLSVSINERAIFQKTLDSSGWGGTLTYDELIAHTEDVLDFSQLTTLVKWKNRKG